MPNTKSDYNFECRQASSDEKNFVISSIKKHTAEADGIVTDNPQFSVLCFDKNKLIAAVIGYVFWNWFFADLVWVDEAHRGQGLGRQIMQQAEEQARAKNLTGIYLWTQSWQAPSFYEKLGYEKQTEFKDFPPGHTRMLYGKYL